MSAPLAAQQKAPLAEEQKAPLAAQQEAILRALWAARDADAAEGLLGGGTIAPASHAQWQRGLVAYRSNGLALAQRALLDAYPVVARLVGDETFEHLAHALWRAQPPQRGDVALWGAALPLFIESIGELASAEPYLADVARVEWRLHEAAGAADAQADAASFAWLASEDPGEVRLHLSPAAAAVESAYPVVAILQAHRAAQPDLSAAAAMMRQGAGESAIVWREGAAPRVRAAAPGEAAFIAAVKESRSLADSLSMAEGFDFGAWLAPAVTQGLLLAVERR